MTAMRGIPGLKIESWGARRFVLTQEVWARLRRVDYFSRILNGEFGDLKVPAPSGVRPESLFASRC